jgi:hypothetical protein
MGANAQTSVPLYVAAEILTAADMNISAGTGVPVFATTVTRDAAFGGAGEKVLAEGQLCYLESTDVVQQYNGSSWITVGPAAAATSGLTCVKAETAFGPVATVTADSIFTSTYTNYLLLFNYTTSTTNFPQIKLRVGGVSASTAYTSQQMQGFSGSVTTNARSAATSFEFAYYGNATKEATVLSIMGPQLAQATQFVTGGGALGGALVQNIYGLHTTATAYDGIEILVATGTMTGTYAIYGYSKTV